MDILVTRTVEALLLPPGGVILLILLGIFLVRRLYRTGIFMILSGFVLLIISSLPGGVLWWRKRGTRQPEIAAEAKAER